VLPRLDQALAPGGVLAIVDQAARNLPWGEDLLKLILRHTTNPEVQGDFDLIAELERRRLREPYGRRTTAPVRFRQSLDEYVERLALPAVSGEHI